MVNHKQRMLAAAAAGPLISKVIFDVRETSKCRLIDERIELCDRFFVSIFSASKARAHATCTSHVDRVLGTETKN